MESKPHICVSNRTIFALALAVLAGAAYGQSHNSRYIVPKSNNALPGHKHTHYYISAFPRVMPWHAGGGPNGPSPQGGGIPGLFPSDMAKAYLFPDPANLGQNTIVIVDAFDYSTALQDFNTFSKQFQLPTESSSDVTNSNNKVFQVAYAGGSKPIDGANQGWNGEEALDIEWAHAMAPNAKIVLMEAQSNGGTDLEDAVLDASKVANVTEISDSWGSIEFPDEQTFDQQFYSLVQNAVLMFSSGDAGGVQSYPAESPWVVGVGGTHLDFDATGNFLDETAWNGSGGGPSAFEPIPAYQSVISSVVGTVRGCPDISADADPDSGAAVFCTTEFGGWAQIGGTSLSCPLNAGIHNARGSINQNALQELNAIYSSYYGGPNFRDVTQGTAGGNSAKVGWDYITGIGSPVGPLEAASPPIGLHPISVVAVEGTAPVTGKKALAELFLRDGLTYNVGSMFVPRLGTVASAQMTFKLPAAPADVRSLVWQEWSAGPANASMLFYLYNYQTLSWDYQIGKQATLKVTKFSPNIFRTLVPIGAKASAYLNAKNQFQVLVRYLVPTRLGTAPFVMKIDYAEGAARVHTG